MALLPLTPYSDYLVVVAAKKNLDSRCLTVKRYLKHGIHLKALLKALLEALFKALVKGFGRVS